MYTILVTENNELLTTKKECIMQRSKLVDSLQFLTATEYKGTDMKDFECVLEYVRPNSRKYKVKELLVLSESTYDGYLQYTLPLDTELTEEAGQVELTLTFSALKMDENGKPVQYVRKTSVGYLDITPITAWSDIIPDEALTPLDQRILMLQGIANQLEAAQEENYQEIKEKLATKADDISYKDNAIQLMSEGKEIGTRHVLEQQTEFDIVDFGESNNDFEETTFIEF